MNDLAMSLRRINMLTIFILLMIGFGVLFILLSIIGLFALVFNAMFPLDFLTVLSVFGFGAVLLIIGALIMTFSSLIDYHNFKKGIK